MHATYPNFEFHRGVIQADGLVEERDEEAIKPTGSRTETTGWKSENMRRGLLRACKQDVHFDGPYRTNRHKQTYTHRSIYGQPPERSKHTIDTHSCHCSSPHKPV
jgi:hypothetical protein